jgi:hypothetical protein
MTVCCGIDLGTTYSSIAWFNPASQLAEAIPLAHANGSSAIRSIVCYDRDNQAAIIGSNVAEAVPSTAGNTALAVKDLFAAEMVIASSGTSLPGRKLAADFLRVLRSDAEHHLAEEVREAVLAVPAGYSERQRQTIKEAAEEAGFSILELMAEPCATTLAFLAEATSRLGFPHTLVCDFGGGTFDVDLVKVDRVYPGCDLSGIAVELAERGPSRRIEMNLGGTDSEETANVLQQEASTLLLRALQRVEDTHRLYTAKRIGQMGTSPHQLNLPPVPQMQILLSGGLSRMPLLRELVAELTGETPKVPSEPELLVSKGAACRAHQLRLPPSTLPASPAVARSPDAPREREIAQAVSPAEAIAVFRSFDLLLTDSDQKIQDAVERRHQVALRRLQSPDPQVRASAEAWMKNSVALQKQREGLLKPVRVLFGQHADAIFAATRPDHREHHYLQNLLENHAKAFFGCDDELAKSLVTDFLSSRKIAPVQVQAHPPRLTAPDVIEMFFTLGLPATDDKDRIDKAIVEREAHFLIEAGPDRDSITRQRAELWLETARRVRRDRAQLLDALRVHFFSFADVAYAERMRPGARGPTRSFWHKLTASAQSICRCTPEVALRFVNEYSRRRGFPGVKEDYPEGKRPRAARSKRRRPMVYVSYSHQDSDEKDALVKHLGVLQAAGLLDIWVDDNIGGGDDWLQAIEDALHRASAAVLLVTKDFLQSEFVLGKEIPILLERRRSDGLQVFAVIAKPCAWHFMGWLRGMQVRPAGATPIWSSGFPFPDEPLEKIVQEIGERLAP